MNLDTATLICEVRVAAKLGTIPADAVDYYTSLAEAGLHSEVEHVLRTGRPSGEEVPAHEYCVTNV